MTNVIRLMSARVGSRLLNRVIRRTMGSVFLKSFPFGIEVGLVLAKGGLILNFSNLRIINQKVNDLTAFFFRQKRLLLSSGVHERDKSAPIVFRGEGRINGSGRRMALGTFFQEKRICLAKIWRILRNIDSGRS